MPIRLWSTCEWSDGYTESSVVFIFLSEQFLYLEKNSNLLMNRNPFTKLKLVL